MKVKRVELRQRIEKGEFPCEALTGSAPAPKQTAAAASAPKAQDTLADLPGQDDIEKQVAAFFADALSISQPVAPTAHFVNLSLIHISRVTK